MKNEVINKEIKESILLSVVLIVLGVILFIRNIDFVESMMNFFGIILIVAACVLFLLYFRLNKTEKSLSNDIYKILSLFLIGIVFIFKGELFTNLIPILIGSFFVIRNFGKIQGVINLHHQDYISPKYLYGLIGFNIILTLAIIFPVIDFHISDSKYIAIIIIVTELIMLYINFFLLKLQKKKGVEVNEDNS